MKVFVIACLAVAAVAQPQWGPVAYNGLTGYTGYTGYTGLPLVQPALYANPLWAKQPVVKPEDMKYEQEMKEEKVETYMQEEKKEEYKPVTMAYDIYGRLVPVVKPVEYKVEVQPKYVSKSGPVEHRVYKREAEAEPIYPYTGMISPYTTAYTHGVYSPMVSPYTTGMVSPFTTPYKFNPVMYKSFIPQPVAKVTYSKPEIVSNAKTVADDSVSPFYYAGKNAYVADSEGALHIAKREAEPDHHFGFYNAAISPYYKPAVQSIYKNIYGQPIATPFVQQPYMAYGAKPFLPLAVPQYKVKSYSNDAVKSEDYASKGEYVAETEGSLHIAKRSAEPLTYLKTAQGVQINRPYMPAFTSPIYNQAAVYKFPYTTGVYTGMPFNTAPFGYSGYVY